MLPQPRGARQEPDAPQEPEDEKPKKDDDDKDQKYGRKFFKNPIEYCQFSNQKKYSRPLT